MVRDLLQFFERTVTLVTTVRRVAAFWGPVTDASSLLAPLLALASVVALALLTGLAAGSVALLIVALVALYLLLTEVLGVSIEIAR
ncbi:MAG: hypothetical protein U0587_18870 [Candidatus Binatia bacterium]